MSAQPLVMLYLRSRTVATLPLSHAIEDNIWIALMSQLNVLAQACNHSNSVMLLVSACRLQAADSSLIERDTQWPATTCAAEHEHRHVRLPEARRRERQQFGLTAQLHPRQALHVTELPFVELRHDRVQELFWRPDEHETHGAQPGHRQPAESRHGLRCIIANPPRVNEDSLLESSTEAHFTRCWQGTKLRVKGRPQLVSTAGRLS